MALTEAAIGAIGASAAAVGSASIGATATAVANRKSYKYSKKLMDYQNQINIQNWNAQNAYNSPAAQMQRYQEAGLNPNLMYGNGDSGNASSVPSVSQGNFKYQKVIEGQELAQTALQTLAMQKELKLKDAQIDATQTQATKQQLANDLQQTYINSLIAYSEDKSNTKNPVTSHWTSEYASQVRKSPFYVQFEKSGVSLNQANQILSNLQTQGTILEYQAGNMNAAENLLSGDFNSVGDVIRGILQLLFAGRGPLKSL